MRLDFRVDVAFQRFCILFRPTVASGNRIKHYIVDFSRRTNVALLGVRPFTIITGVNTKTADDSATRADLE